MIIGAREAERMRGGGLLAVVLLVAASCGGARTSGGGASPPQPPELACDSRPTATQWRPAILDSGPFLPDFSFAGFKWGAQPPRMSHAMQIDVTELGARANDDEDDTPALREALRRAHATPQPVVVVLPKGKLILRDILWIHRSDLVIRGAGSGDAGTMLYVDRGLDQLPVPAVLSSRAEAMRERGAPYSLYSWLGGFIWARHPDDSCQASRPAVSQLTGTRGGHEVKGTRTETLAANDVLVLQWFADPSGTLLAEVLGGERVDVGAYARRTDVPLVTQPVTVAEVFPDGFRTVEPLLHDLRPAWQSSAVPLGCYLSNVGVEGLTIAFPSAPYSGHHAEDGYNAVAFTHVRHGWITDVAVINADSGFLVERSSQITLSRIRTTGRGGHYSAIIGFSYGVLVKDFFFAAAAVHNPSFNSAARGSVFTHGVIFDARLDQHMSLNYQNLYDDITTYASSRHEAEKLFQRGGSRENRPTAGAYSVFWNISLGAVTSGAGPLRFNPIKDAPHARLVGITAREPFTLDYGPVAHVEDRPGQITPASLYAYQRCMRERKRARPGNAGRITAPAPSQP